MVILVVFNSFNVVKNLKKPDLGRVKSPHFTLLLRTGVSDQEFIFEITKVSAAEKERVAMQSKGKNTTGK